MSYNKYMRSRIWVVVLVLLFNIFIPFSYAAQNPPCVPEEGKICNPISGVGSISELIRSVLVKALQIGIPLVALAIIYSGFLFVFARGNEEKLSTAKSALLYSIIGAAILLGSWAIAELIQNTVVGLQ